MTTMFDTTATQVAIQCENQNAVQDADQTTQAKNSPAKRRKYSGNDVLRLMKVLDQVKMDMDKQCLSMNDVVHLVQDKLDGMLKTRRCSAADLARLITMAGFPVTESTLKDYLARSRKDAKEGHTVYRDLKEHILSQAGKEKSPNGTDDVAPFLPAEADASDGLDVQDIQDAQNASDDLAVSSAAEAIDAKEMARQHIQDIYAARKRRKKARNAKKQK